jgi:hypothetical protein
MPVLLAGIAAVALIGAGAYLVSRRAEQAARSPARPVGSSTIGAEGAAALHGPQLYDYRPDNLHQAGFALRPMDYDIFEVLEKSEYGREDMLDLFPTQPYHVQMFGSFQDHWIRAIRIDLERDGTWDEHWELGQRTVKRTQVRPGALPIPSELRPGHWLPH